MNRLVLNSLYSLVFRWMSLGMAITSVFGFIVSYDRRLVTNIVNDDFILLFDLLLLLVLTYILSTSANAIPKIIVKVFFFAYASLLGLTISLFFEVVYGIPTWYIFAIGAFAYAILSAIHVFTDYHIPEMRYPLIFFIVAIALNTLLNAAWFNSMSSWVTSLFLLGIFTSVLAVDMQMVKMYKPIQRYAFLRKTALAALLLQIDIINISYLILGFTDPHEIDHT